MININSTVGDDHFAKQQPITQENYQRTQINITQPEYGNNSERQFIREIEKANHIQIDTTECQFSIHEKTKQIMIKLVNTDTKEIVKEIPSEKILDMVAGMCERAGLFIDEKR